MAANNIDELSIKITASTRDAVLSVNTLSKSLRNLGTSLSQNVNSQKLDGTVQSIQGLSSAVKQLGSATRGINNLPKLTTELTGMLNSLSNAPQVSENVLELVKALGQLNGLNVKNLGSAVNGATTSVSESTPEAGSQGSTTQAVSGTNDALEETAQKSEEAQTGVSKLLNTKGSALLNGLKKLGSGISSAANGFIKLRNATKKWSSSAQSSFKKGLKTILRYGFGIRSLFVLTNKLRSAIEEGNKNLVHYSSEFNKSMSTIKSSVGVFKNSLSVAFAPIVNWIAPAVANLINLFVRLNNAIARMFGLLTGAKVVAQASNYYKDYAKSLDKASKSTSQLLALDEINNLTSSSSSDSDTDYGDMFDTANADDGSVWADIFKRIRKAWEELDLDGIYDACYDLGNKIGESLRDALDNIDWTTIQTKARLVGSGLAGLINGFVETSGLGNMLGKTLAEGINTGIDLVDEFVGRTHFKSIGKFLADGLTGAIKNIQWKTLADAISKGVIGALNTISSFIKNADWFEIGDTIKDFLCAIDWNGIFVAVFDVIGAIIGGAGSFLAGALKDAVLDIRDYFKSYIDQYIANCPTEQNLGYYIISGVLAGIINAIKNIGVWIYDNILTPFVQGFRDAFQIHSPSKVMEEQGGYIMDGVKEGISAKIDAVVELFTTLKTKIVDKFTDIKTSIVNALQSVVNGGKTILNKALAGIESFINNVILGVNGLTNLLNTAIGGMISGLNALLSNTGITLSAFSIPSIGKVSIPRLANGGIVPDAPNTGSLFWAGENGAEIVGHANNRTEVLNESQISRSIAAGVNDAIEQALAPYLNSLVNTNEEIANKDFSISGDSVFKSVRNSARIYSKSTGVNAFAF